MQWRTGSAAAPSTPAVAASNIEPCDASVSTPPEGPSQWTFQPIADARVYERVVDQITFAIRSGAYAVGERLPSVEQMAHAMNVSKPTIGEAIRVLASRGVVQSRRGVNGGVTVIDDNIPITLLQLANGRNEANLRELLEARRPVEMEIARLAARRADETDIASMDDSIAKLAAHVGADGELRLHFDHFFHYAMGRAARSELLAYYQHQTLEGITVLLHDYFTTQEDPNVVVDLHRRTLDVITGGHLGEVDRVMDEHLTYLERAVL
jgi:GntR family transcriptional regulator, transcriptional repressor for pyruvate dehydrogenase complex